jgi:chromosome segregation ATPase
MPSLLGQVGSRAVLRESLRQLTVLRVACGRESDLSKAAMPQASDEFTHRAQWFEAHAEECKTAIAERNDAARYRSTEAYVDQARANNIVNSSLDKMKGDLEQLERMLSEAQHKLFKAQEAKKSEDKIKKLEKTVNQRRDVVKQATPVLANLRAEAARSLPVVRALQPDGKQRTLVRQQMAILREAQSVRVNVDGHDPFVDAEQAAREEREFGQEQAAIKAQREAIDQGLDRLNQAVMRIRHQAVGIGEELESQNAMLVVTHERIQQQAVKVKQLNKTVKDVLKKQGPLNMCINAFCFILLLGLVGFFLFKFKVL